MATQEIDRTSYRELLAALQPKTIRSQRQYTEMLRSADELMRRRRRTAAEDRLLELVVLLIGNYEDERYPVPEAPPHQVLAHLIEAREISQTQLARDTGVSRQLITEILSGRRAISSTNIRKFADYFHVSPEVFLPSNDTP